MLPNGGAWACVEVQNIIVQTVDNVWALSHVHPVPPKTMVVKKPSIKRYLLYFIVIIALNMSHFILRRRRRNVDWSATFLWNACQFRIGLEQLGITFSHAEDLCNKTQLQNMYMYIYLYIYVFSPTYSSKRSDALIQFDAWLWMAMVKCPVGEIESIYLQAIANMFRIFVFLWSRLAHAYSKEPNPGHFLPSQVCVFCMKPAPSLHTTQWSSRFAIDTFWSIATWTAQWKFEMLFGCWIGWLMRPATTLEREDFGLVSF